MTNVSEYLNILSTERLLVCLLCKYALELGGVVAHLNTKHRAIPNYRI